MSSIMEYELHHVHISILWSFSLKKLNFLYFSLIFVHVELYISEFFQEKWHNYKISGWISSAGIHHGWEGVEYPSISGGSRYGGSKNSWQTEHYHLCFSVLQLPACITSVYVFIFFCLFFMLNLSTETSYCIAL